MIQTHSLLTLICVLALCIIRLRLNICLDILLIILKFSTVSDYELNMFNRETKPPFPSGKKKKKMYGS